MRRSLYDAAEGTSSVWTSKPALAAVTSPALAAGPLREDVEVDVAVVGGGITGATTALLLKRQGLRVGVLEAAVSPPWGETSRSTAHLTQALDLRPRRLISRFGEEAAAQVTSAHAAAIDLIEELAQAHAPGAGFARVPGFLVARTDDEVAALDDEATATELLRAPVSLVDEVPLSLGARRALRWERQAQINPAAYLLGLLGAVAGDGSFVAGDSRALTITEGSGDEPCRVETARGTVRARVVINAAHVPINTRIFLHTKIASYRTYVVAARAEGLPADVGLFWDMSAPYRYWRAAQVGDETLLLVGGEDHKVGQNDDTLARFEPLEAALAFTLGGRPIVVARWSGQVVEPVDGLPYIGHKSLGKKVLVATGYAGNGLTGGTLAAMLLCDEVQGRAHPWSELFASTRVRPLASARAFVRENANTTRHLVGDRFTHAAGGSVAGIAPGEGAVVDVGGESLAVYRDQGGRVYACSATCTHLGCTVAWNRAERSWDCPCHGSRFDAFGDVLNGPAVEPLEPRPFEPERETETPLAGEGLGLPELA